MYSLESPHLGDSNEYTQHNIISIKKNHPKYPRSVMSAAMAFCLLGAQDEFEIAVVNESSVFESLKFYCNSFICEFDKAQNNWAKVFKTNDLVYIFNL